MSASFISVLIYLLGFIGLASVGLLPIRSWQVLRGILKDSIPQMRRKILASLAALIAAAALWSDVQITALIFRCLTETYCGPNIASGWTYLAVLGVVYLAFEMIIFVVRKIGRNKVVRAAT